MTIYRRLMTIHLVGDGELTRSVALRCRADRGSRSSRSISETVRGRDPELFQRSVVGPLDGHRDSGLAERGEFDDDLLAGAVPAANPIPQIHQTRSKS
jgi:hypothetical protein